MPPLAGQVIHSLFWGPCSADVLWSRTSSCWCMLVCTTHAIMCSYLHTYDLLTLAHHFRHLPTAEDGKPAFAPHFKAEQKRVPAYDTSSISSQTCACSLHMNSNRHSQLHLNKSQR